MKAFILVSFLVAATSAALLEEHALKFQEFKLKHDKTYDNQVEELKRFAIFRDNLQSIEEHNALYAEGLVSYKKGINQFTDMTQEEFRAMLTLQSKPTLGNTVKYVKTGADIPSSLDWRPSGQVTPVKTQGQCGACWSFIITGVTECAYYRKYNQTVYLSEQQLIDCTTDVNSGCAGGYLDYTFPYVQKNGLQSEESYVYIAENSSCKYDQSQVVTKVDSYVSIDHDEDALLEAVATVGPVGVAIDATYLHSYKSGVFAGSKCSPQGLNHGGLVVGYGKENGQKYWLIKNSWGPTWGDQGYFKLLRGQNECGVAEDNVYPVIN